MTTSYRSSIPESVKELSSWCVNMRPGQVYLSLHEELRVLIGAIKHLECICGLMKTSYIKHHLLTEHEWNFFMRTDFDTGIDLPTKNRSHDSAELCDCLLQDHYDVWVFQENLQYAMRQQLESDRDLLSVEFQQVVLALRSLLDRLEALLNLQGIEIRHRVDPSTIFMKKNKPEHSKHRYMRDFVVLKKSEAFARAMIVAYDRHFYSVTESESYASKRE